MTGAFTAFRVSPPSVRTSPSVQVSHPARTTRKEGRDVVRVRISCAGLAQRIICFVLSGREGEKREEEEEEEEGISLTSLHYSTFSGGGGAEGGRRVKNNRSGTDGEAPGGNVVGS